MISRTRGTEFTQGFFSGIKKKEKYAEKQDWFTVPLGRKEKEDPYFLKTE